MLLFGILGWYIESEIPVVELMCFKFSSNYFTKFWHVVLKENIMIMNVLTLNSLVNFTCEKFIGMFRSKQNEHTTIISIQLSWNILHCTT